MKPTRALRADAERNRRHVLAVAEKTFATEGLAVPIDEIARRAGLGVGTLYRHFPTKEALCAAIVVTRMEDVIIEARELQRLPDPSQSFFAILVRMVDGWKVKKDFIEALSTSGMELDEVKRTKERMNVELGKLLAHAQSVGTVREDVSVSEIIALIAGAFGSLDRHGITPKGRDRMLAIVFDGLRPPLHVAEMPVTKKRKKHDAG